MKIVCENCGAKYSIADEKVKGKVFKIRCKKCSESILVRGDAPKPEPEIKSAPQAPEEEGEAETRVFDYGAGSMPGTAADADAEPIWHIVVEDQQQGPYSESQMKEYLSMGSITADTLVWREGFDDWMLLRDVPEFGIPSDRSQRGAAMGGLFDDQPAAKGGGGLFDDQPGGGGLFSGPVDTSSPFDSGGGLFGDGGGDVFSSTAPEPAGGGLFGEAARSNEGIFAAKPQTSGSGEGIFSAKGDEPRAAAPGPRVSAEQAMLTGQRNENSVLFSLSNLQALAAAPAKETENQGGFGFGTPASSGEEASGLIDIRSLAGSISTSEQNDGVDELISLSGGGFSPALGAPVLAAQNDGMSSTAKIGIIAGGIAALVLIVVVLVVALSGDDEARTQAEAQIMALQRQIEELSRKGGASNDEAIAALQARLKEKQGEVDDADGKASAVGAEKGDEDNDKKKDDDKASSSASKSKKVAAAPSSTASSSSRRRGGGSGESSAATPDPEPAASASKAKPSGTSELDDLLGGAASARAKSKPAAPSTTGGGGGGGGGNVKDKLSRADVQNGMASVAAAVQRCGQGKGGSITMNIVIGTTGRVSSASAVGAFAGTPIGSCAARAVRRARFPASQNNLTVKYPFKL